MKYSQKSQTPPSGHIGRLSCASQDQQSTEKCLNPRQVRN
uniref:Uncharacterized protein n=1 Tax=Anguilla anguilla TaxID=7936 RepID=A0A0E9RF04_ANGAN